MFSDWAGKRYWICCCQVWSCDVSRKRLSASIRVCWSFAFRCWTRLEDVLSYICDSSSIILLEKLYECSAYDWLLFQWPSFPGWASRVYFSDNGSTAIEIALKMAFRKFCVDHAMLLDSAEQQIELLVSAEVIEQNCKSIICVEMCSMDNPNSSLLSISALLREHLLFIAEAGMIGCNSCAPVNQIIYPCASSWLPHPVSSPRVDTNLLVTIWFNILLSTFDRF